MCSTKGMETKTLVTIEQENKDDPVAIADALLPAFDGDNDKKREYLSYRLCGFSRHESAKYADIHFKTIGNWVRRDPDFARIEKTNLLELRREFSRTISLFEFTRNFKLVLSNDFVILDKVKTRGIHTLTKYEKDYLDKMRSMYTPQQYTVLEELFENTRGGEDFDWTLLVKGRGTPPFSPTLAPQDS
jgi:hypothetical protein